MRDSSNQDGTSDLVITIPMFISGLGGTQKNWMQRGANQWQVIKTAPLFNCLLMYNVRKS